MNQMCVDIGSFGLFRIRISLTLKFKFIMVRMKTFYFSVLSSLLPFNLDSQIRGKLLKTFDVAKLYTNKKGCIRNHKSSNDRH